MGVFDWLAIVINIILHWLFLLFFFFLIIFWQKQSVKLTFAPLRNVQRTRHNNNNNNNKRKIRLATCCNIAAQCSAWDAAGQEASPVAFCLPFLCWAGPQNWLRGKTKLKTQKMKPPKHIWHSFGVDRVQRQSVHREKFRLLVNKNCIVLILHYMRTSGQDTLFHIL